MVQLRMGKYSGVTPLTDVVQFASSERMVSLAGSWGAARATAGASRRMAARSS